MSGYIGSKSSVTLVSGYTRADADAAFVAKAGDSMTGALDVTGTVTATSFVGDGSGLTGVGGGVTESIGTATAGTLDLSTGTVFDYVTTGNITIAFSNPPSEAGDAQGFTLKITGSTGFIPYDISAATYTNNSFAVGSQEGNPSALDFNADGTKMVVIGKVKRRLYPYTLSTAYDITTATYDGASTALGSTAATVDGLKFSSDGLNVYVTDSTNDMVYQFNLTSAFDVTTLNATAAASLDVSTLDGLVKGVSINNDGTRIYLAGQAGKKVYQYDMSTPYDLSTAVLNSTNLYTFSNDQLPTGIAFNPTGTKLVITGDQYDKFYEYELSTAWDVSTAVHNNSSITTGGKGARDIKFDDTGTKLFLVSSVQDSVYEFSTTSGGSVITYPSSVQWAGGEAPSSPETGLVDILTFYTEDGGTTYYGFKAGSDMQ